MEQGRLTQLRQLVRDAVATDAQPETSEAQANRAFLAYSFNVAEPVLEQTPRARAQREIDRIATWYAWGPLEVRRWLDRSQVVAVSALAEPTLELLLARMTSLEDCAQNGIAPPDAPTAY
ncbi:hypothetical protein [Lysobacter sp. CA199]|uniref:hypothetical protein n=1 Tax=Lysobacter sp. CA199 TaxID=3455608 RepID=UPI003F8D4377